MRRQRQEASAGGTGGNGDNDATDVAPAAGTEKKSLLRRQESAHLRQDTADPVPAATPSSPAASAKQLHAADAAEGDRRKFYHQAVEQKTVGDGDQSEDKFDAFVRWMKENGAQFPDQHLVKYTEEVRGVHALNDIPAHRQIATIPLHLLIHEGHGQQTREGSAVWNCRNNNIIVPAHTQVIIYLLTTGARDAANGKPCDHKFAPYYRILPKTFSSFPIFWDEDELQWLEGSDLVQQVRDRRRNILADYREVSRIVPDFGERFTEDDFLWCRTAVGSRNFGISIDGVKRTTMVPWADMLNHYRPRETSWTYDNSQQAFTMTSLKTLSSGQQVMDSYGKKCNSKFLMHYGFAIEKNIEEDGKCMNEMPLRLTFDSYSLEDEEASMLHSRRVQLLSPRVTLRLKMHYDDAATGEAISFCRVAVANDAELSEIEARGYRHDNHVLPVSARNEIAALAFLAEACRRRLERYPTLYEEDKILINEGDLEPFSNRRNALIVIMSEKEILHFFIKLSQIAAPILSKPLDEAMTHVEAEYNDPRDNYGRYLRGVVDDLQSLTRYNDYY